MNKLLAVGGVDAAFVCASPYVEGHDQFGLALLVIPLVKASLTTCGYEVTADHLAETCDLKKFLISSARGSQSRQKFYDEILHPALLSIPESRDGKPFVMQYWNF